MILRGIGSMKSIQNKLIEQKFILNTFFLQKPTQNFNESHVIKRRYSDHLQNQTAEKK
jgi:hypothetical protein